MFPPVIRPCPAMIHGNLYLLGARPRPFSVISNSPHFDVKIQVDDAEWPSPTHNIDYYKNRVGIEMEWNNKDPFFDRDLNNFRLLHQIEDYQETLVRVAALEQDLLGRELSSHRLISQCGPRPRLA